MRAFLEECDSLQVSCNLHQKSLNLIYVTLKIEGLSISLDAGHFGGFGISLLESFRDEYPKHSIFCNVLHSGLVNVAELVCVFKFINEEL